MHVKSLDILLDPEDFNEKKEIIIELLDDSIDSVRNLSFMLYPPYIDEIDFIELISRLSSIFEKKLKISVVLNSSIDQLTLPLKTQRILFRSIRELLINFVKHNTSKNIAISISIIEKNLVIKASSDNLITKIDDIKKKILQKKRFGILILKENLKLIGAKFDFLSEKGFFCITLKLK